MAANEPTPGLNHADFAGNSFHTHGLLHLRKKDGNNHDLTSTGFVRGSNLKIGLEVQVKQNVRIWDGTIISGPHLNSRDQQYWTFTVTNTVDLPDLHEDDTVTVTVTNPNATPPISNSQPSDPQPDIVIP
jgi:hypothetical protein